jgi:hypothetical protein
MSLADGGLLTIERMVEILAREKKVGGDKHDVIPLIIVQYLIFISSLRSNEIIFADDADSCIMNMYNVLWCC